MSASAPSSPSSHATGRRYRRPRRLSSSDETRRLPDSTADTLAPGDVERNRNILLQQADLLARLSQPPRQRHFFVCSGIGLIGAHYRSSPLADTSRSLDPTLSRPQRSQPPRPPRLRAAFNYERRCGHGEVQDATDEQRGELVDTDGGAVDGGGGQERAGAGIEFDIGDVDADRTSLALDGHRSVSSESEGRPGDVACLEPQFGVSGSVEEVGADHVNVAFGVLARVRRCVDDDLNGRELVVGVDLDRAGGQSQRGRHREQPELLGRHRYRGL